jgi:endoglucanase
MELKSVAARVLSPLIPIYKLVTNDDNGEGAMVALNGAPQATPPSNDINSILQRSWDYYKRSFIAQDGRPLGEVDLDDVDLDDDTAERLTDSEKISYVLKRARMMDDKKTFDRVWTWTKNNVQRQSIAKAFDPKSKTWKTIPTLKRDHLFAWRYCPGLGEKAGGVLVYSDFDPASDADQDIAAELWAAHRKWGSNGAINYQNEARDILTDIWDKETKEIAERRVLIAGDTQIYTKDPMTGKPTFGVNPSYFRPTYYSTVFPAADPAHDWRSLILSSYEVIERSADATMHDEEGKPVEGKVNLPPDFAALDRDFNIRDHGWKKGDHKRNKDYFFNGDAFRTLFWMAIQAELFPSDTAARHYITDSSGTKADFGPLSFLKKELSENKTIWSDYNIDGTVHWRSETPQTLSTYMYYFRAAGNKEASDQMYSRLMMNYDPDGFWRAEPNDFVYAQNWAWFNLYVLVNGPKNILGEN